MPDPNKVNSLSFAIQEALRRTIQLIEGRCQISKRQTEGPMCQIGLRCMCMEILRRIQQLLLNLCPQRLGCDAAMAER